MSNNEAQRLAEVVGEVADEFHHNAKNFTKGSLAQIEHHKYRDDLNAASDMLGRIAELETERDALKAGYKMIGERFCGDVAVLLELLKTMRGADHE